MADQHMTTYQRGIAAATGITAIKAIDAIEDLMRIDSPTLDHLTRAAFNRLARSCRDSWELLGPNGRVDHSRCHHTWHRPATCPECGADSFRCMADQWLSHTDPAHACADYPAWAGAIGKPIGSE